MAVIRFDWELTWETELWLSPLLQGGTVSGAGTQVTMTGVPDTSDTGPRAPCLAMVTEELSKDKVAYGKIKSRDLGLNFRDIFHDNFTTL